jgi:oligopeptidase B
MLDRPLTLASPPRADKRPQVSTWHGVSLIDDYAWLKAPNWREVMRDPGVLPADIRAHLEAENAHAAAVMAPTATLQEILFAEMKARIKEDDSSVPAPDGPFAYFHRYRDGGQHPSICRQARQGGDEVVLLDGDALAAGKPFFQFGGADHSPDHARLAWSCDDKGSEAFTIRVRDLGHGGDLDDIITETTGGVVWTADSQSFYYTRIDAQHRPTWVMRHRLGTAVADDVVVFESEDPAFFLSIDATQSRHHAVISLDNHETSACWLIDLAAADATPTPIAERETAVRYAVEHHPAFMGQDVLVFRTNADGAEDFKIAWAPRRTPDRAHWRDLVPHRAGVYILSFAMFADWLVRVERQDGLPRIVVRHLASGDEHTIAFSEEAYSLGFHAGYEFATDTLRFEYSSMTTPAETWDYRLSARTRDLRKRQEVPSGHDPAAYVTRRLFAPTPDGETVPISLLHRKDVALDGTAPCLLYGYGSYGHSIPAAFATSRLSLVDRGVVYAIAHIRGGTEKGWRWYREGKLARKQNTFRDFIAAGDYLRGERLVAPDRIVAHGGSAGGLLMGAVANMRPDLFAGVIADVPFVDALNTMLDDSLPLTPPEQREWGDPIADPDAFRTMLAYSPYENVRAQDYPAMLALGGLTDPRVAYWEPAKWVARLREMKTDNRLVALRINMEAGHGGASGRFERLKEVALVYAFALVVAGVMEAKAAV